MVKTPCTLMVTFSSPPLIGVATLALDSAKAMSMPAGAVLAVNPPVSLMNMGAPNLTPVPETHRERLKMLEREMPNVTAHVPRPSSVKLLPLNRRSRVGSAPGRDAQKKFCQ